ncbi:hypothetical protein [Roseococcus thiosulfatophilus]|uniref:hypothetical protein n=1 Tax=Roseococcus thiosulfatophilus TaxID=35813 RepID=UPI001A8E146F|nr:hypothetical protein [Roseococcus thiosulfatophilus]
MGSFRSGMGARLGLGGAGFGAGFAAALGPRAHDGDQDGNQRSQGGIEVMHRAAS